MLFSKTYLSNQIKSGFASCCSMCRPHLLLFWVSIVDREPCCLGRAGNTVDRSSSLVTTLALVCVVIDTAYTGPTLIHYCSNICQLWNTNIIYLEHVTTTFYTHNINYQYQWEWYDSINICVLGTLWLFGLVVLH